MPDAARAGAAERRAAENRDTSSAAISADRSVAMSVCSAVAVPCQAPAFRVSSAVRAKVRAGRGHAAARASAVPAEARRSSAARGTMRRRPSRVVSSAPAVGEFTNTAGRDTEKPGGVTDADQQWPFMGTGFGLDWSCVLSLSRTTIASRRRAPRARESQTASMNIGTARDVTLSIGAC